MWIFEAIGKRLSKLCYEKEISVYSLANKCGISCSNFKNILYGKSTNPEIKIILHICNGSNIPFADSFDSPSFDNYKNFKDLL